MAVFMRHIYVNFHSLSQSFMCCLLWSRHTGNPARVLMFVMVTSHRESCPCVDVCYGHVTQGILPTC